MLTGAVHTALVGISIALSFVTTPLMLSRLGAVGFGTFRYLLELSGQAVILESALAASLVPLLSASVAVGDRALIGRRVGLALTAYAVLSIVLFGASMVLYLFFSSNRVPSVQHVELGPAWLILSLGLVAMPTLVFRALLEASQRGYWVAVIQGSQVLVVTICQVIVAGFFPTVAVMCAIFVACSFVGGALVVMIAIKCVPFEWSRSFLGERSELRAFAVEGWSNMILSILGRLGYLSDGLIIGSSLGPSTLADVSVTGRLCGIALSQLQMVGHVSWAGLAELYHVGDLAGFRRVLNQLTMIVSVGGLTLVVPIAIWGEEFVGLWVGEGHFAGAPYLYLSCFNVWIWSICSLWGWPLSALGRNRLYVPYLGIATVVNLAVGIYLASNGAVYGPALGTALSFVGISSWALPISLWRATGVSSGVLIKSATYCLPAGCVFLLISIFIHKMIPANGWSSLALGIGLSELLWCGLTLSVALPKVVKDELVAVIISGWRSKWTR